MKLGIKSLTRYIISFASAFILLISCSDWLEEESISKYAMSDFYRNQEELEAGLLGVYADVRSIYMNDSKTIANVGTDEIYVGIQSSNQAIADRYEHASSYNMVTQWYRIHYRIIQRANIVINRAPEVPNIAQADIDRIVGEARALRAFCYFRLVQTFGRVPLVLTETTDEDFNFTASRAPIEAVYESIFEDLTFASKEGVLPTTPNSSHINTWTAKGLLAKTYLTLATSILRRPQPVDEYRTLKWDTDILLANCCSLCDEIINSGQYSLANKYGDNFLISKKNGVESMWEIQFSSEYNMGSNWSKQFGVIGEGYNTAPTENCLVGQAQYKPVPGFYRYFKLGDTRRTWSLADYRVSFSSNKPSSLIYLKNTNINSVSTEMVNMDTDDRDSLMRTLTSNGAMKLGVSKYRWGTNEDTENFWKENMSFAINNCPNNVIILRFADVLLMRVESDMLSNHGVASARSLDIMNSQILARARGWNETAGRYYTEEEMLETTMAPYEAMVEKAEADLALDPANPNLQAKLQWLQWNREEKRKRCLVNYTQATLTYDELMTQRACELCFEFNRWFDLARTGTLHTIVPNRLVDPSTVPPIQFDFKRHYLYPIPIRELDLARDKEAFYQNYGY